MFKQLYQCSQILSLGDYYTISFNLNEFYVDTWPTIFTICDSNCDHSNNVPVFVSNNIEYYLDKVWSTGGELPKIRYLLKMA